MKRTRRSLIEKGDENVLAKAHEDDKAEISILPLAKKPRMMKTGRWTDEERLHFLTAFRKHGSGKWKEISSIVGTRDKIQVRTHAQNLATKMKNGVDIFADLHEHEHENGEHFGATEPSSSQAVVKSVEPDKRRAKKQHAAKDVAKKGSIFTESLMGVLSAPYKGRGADVKVTFLPLLCVDIEKERIFGCERLKKCGCVVDVFLDPPPLSLHIERIKYLTRRRLEQAYKTRRHSSSVLDDALHHLLCLQTDDMNDILDACARFQRMKSSVGNPFIVLGKDELEWWSGMSIRLEESTSLRTFAFLRRLAMPLCMRLHTNVEETVSFPDFSLLDILLRIEITQSATIDALMLRIVQLERVASKASAALESLARDLQRRLLSSINEAVRINCIDRARYLDSVKFTLAVSSHPSMLRKMVSEELRDVLKPSNISANRVVELQRDSERYDAIAKTWKIPTNQGWKSNQLAWTKRSIVGFEARSCPDETSEGELLIQNMKQAILGKKEAKEVMHEWLTEKLAKKSDILAGKNDGGSLLITSSEMSLERFLQHAGLMNEINEDFPRPLDRPESRPRLRALNMSNSGISMIKSVFFDGDGSLRNEIKSDIDMSLKHGYINFSNTSCSDARNDQRWQVPIRHHSQLRRIGARHALESSLEAEQVIFPQAETLDDVGMLIAGTEDQPLHHDVARAFSAWVSKVNYDAEEEDPVAGWEVGRIDYNEAMASSYAPSSVILGMGEETTVLLGVQKDQTKRVASGKCTVFGGTGETFDIVRETEHLVVIRAERGLMFTGDFPHAGVRNVSQQSPENDLVELLKERISSILGDESLSPRGQRTAIVDMLCDFPGLNKLCRFHCTTQLRDGMMKPQLNTVGFTGCLPNPPKGCSLWSTSLQTLETTTPPAMVARVSPSPPIVVNQKRIGKEDDISPEAGTGIPNMAPEDLYPLVLPEDKALISGYVYLTFGQMQPCLFMEADKIGRYKALEVGYHGLACKHCVGKAGCGRYFLASEASLSQTTTSKTIINHVRNCPGCPIEIRDYLELLPWLKRAKMGPDGKRADKSKYGGRKVFFRRLWCRIQGLPMDEEKTILKKRDKNTYAGRKGSYAQKGQRRSSSSDAFGDSVGSEEENDALFMQDDETESEYEEMESFSDEDESDNDFKPKPPVRATKPVAYSLKKRPEKEGLTYVRQRRQQKE